MKAIQISRFGGPEVLETVDAPRPTPGPGQLLVRVRAAGVNFADTLMRADRYAMTPPLPSILGLEVAGVVEAHGEGVDRTAWPQDGRVAASMFAAGMHFGGYAEYVVIDAGFATAIPDGVSFEAADALMVQGLSAHYLLRQAPAAGKTVLINAAAGGVGSFLVQLARRQGAARIIAAASSPEKLAFAGRIGADELVNYSQADWADVVKSASDGRGPDVIYESVGGAIVQDSLAMLAPGGQIAIYGALNIRGFQFGDDELRRMIFMNQSLTGFALAPLLTPDSLKRDLMDLFTLAVDGKLAVTIDSVFPLADASEAHRRLESRRSMGKVILVP